MRLQFIVSLLAILHVFARTPTKFSHDSHDYYVLEHIPQPSGAPLDDVARFLGVEVVEQAGELQDVYIVRTLKPAESSSFARAAVHDRVIETLKSLQAKTELSLEIRSEEALQARKIISSVNYLSRQHLRQRMKRAPPPLRPSLSSTIAERLGIQDPLFSEQWHLVNNEYPDHMMNATPVWDLGITGKGVISSLIDDGLDYEHDDLALNFDAADSYDFNDHVDLPTPKNFDDHHGTRCAGQIAAVKNTACGMGIAYDSKVAGVRILSGPITDVDEASALNYGYQNVSIYSCSWGPPDTGKAMEGPGYIIKKALINGINKGRNGKGSIYVFASGNGAASGDQCNFDGYTNSIYSITVSAIDYKGLHPYYSESCAANMVVAYSSGDGRHIVTTDKGKGACSKTHGGTSAAAPNAVGVFALALEVRPDLTWRDMQHLCVESARIINADDPDWETIASGKKYSYKYGFGVLDAARYVAAAQTWELVKSQAWFATSAVQLGEGTMDAEGNFDKGERIGPNGIQSKITVSKDNMLAHNFEALEHINIRVWINHTYRGDVEISITSPNGIKSVLAGKRTIDRDGSGYPGWIFMSVKHWGENLVGDWTISVSDQQTPNASGNFIGWNMIFWGSAIRSDEARKYEMTLVEDIFPPKNTETMPVIVTDPTGTTQYTKPTAHLPEDHGSAEGENTSPAFSTPTSTKKPESISSSTPTLDEGWFSDMANLVPSQKWLFFALGTVALFGIGASAFFCRRHIQRRLAAAPYSPLGGDDMSMTALAGGRQNESGTSRGRTTKELYDAFGEVSDEDEDANEQTQLTHGETSGLGFHSGFLDDDEPSPAVSTPITHYHDDPPQFSQHDVAQPTSPSGSGGSWVHASRDS